MISIYYTSISLGTAKLYWLLITIRSKIMLTRKQYDIVAGLILVLLVITWLAVITAITSKPEPPCDCITDIECEVTLCSHLGE